VDVATYVILFFSAASAGDIMWLSVFGLYLSIFQVGPGSGRIEKKFCYFGLKKSCP
jgi:hypothetical protein